MKDAPLTLSSRYEFTRREFVVEDTHKGLSGPRHRT